MKKSTTGIYQKTWVQSAANKDKFCGYLQFGGWLAALVAVGYNLNVIRTSGVGTNRSSLNHEISTFLKPKFVTLDVLP